MSDDYVFYDLLAGSSDKSALYVSLVLDNLQRRPPPGVLGFLVPLHCYWLNLNQGPHRLVVRTSRCGRDNPGSTPGVDTWTRVLCRTPRLSVRVSTTDVVACVVCLAMH